MHPRHGILQAILLSIVTIALLCLAGCQAKNTDIAPALPVISDSTYNAERLSVAVGADGSHHLIYVDSGKDISDLVYAYQKKSEPPRLLSIPSGNGLVTKPDIAVTDGGEVVITWMSRGSGGMLPCWGEIDPLHPAAPACNLLSQSPTPNDNEPPILAAYGDRIYAIYTYTTQDNHHNLAARQLEPTLEPAEDLFAGEAGTTYTGYAAKVDSRGMLHCAASYDTATFPHGRYFRYQPDGGLADDELTLTTEAGITIGNPSLDIAYVSPGSDVAYFAFTLSDGTASVIKLYQWKKEIQIETRSFLKVGDAWQIFGKPALSVVNQTPYLFFAASNAAAPGNTDLWSIDASVDQNAPENLTASEANEGAPVAVTAVQAAGEDSDTLFYSPVVFFRHYTADPNLALRKLYGDAFVFDQTGDPFGGDRIRQVFASPGACLRASYDIAVRGDQVFAAWIAPISSTNPRLVPWISTNTNTVYLPSVQR